ncbi:MAG: alkaline phosphatase family protein [Pseudonocardiales bacterium]|nr:alkaline phosphatase family protein [Pseudonocardiales bacterium]
MSDLRAIPAIVQSVRRAASGPVVVLGVDGVPADRAWTRWQPARGFELSSGFPATSATGWLAATTGADQAGHGVPGMVFVEPGVGLVNCVTGVVLARRGTGRTAGVRAGPTFCDTATEEGTAVVVCGRSLSRLGTAWAEAVLGARANRHPPPDRDLGAVDPVAEVKACIAEVDAALDRGAELVWCFVDLDQWMHRHGPTREIDEALSHLDLVATVWSQRGAAVLAHADHGAVPVGHHAGLRAVFDSAADAERCELPPGGAGRVRWLHPRPGHVAEVLRTLRGLGSAAWVGERDDLLASGLVPPAGPHVARIGRVVAIATAAEFPVPDPGCAWEHGALDDAETRVPLALWAAGRAEREALAVPLCPAQSPTGESP